MLCHLKKLSIKQGLKTQYFVILKKYSERITIAVLLHFKKRTTCSGLMKTALNNVVLPTLFKVVNNTEQVDEPELACNKV